MRRLAFIAVAWCVIVALQALTLVVRATSGAVRWVTKVLARASVI